MTTTTKTATHNDAWGTRPGTARFTLHRVLRAMGQKGLTVDEIRAKAKCKVRYGYLVKLVKRGRLLRNKDNFLLARAKSAAKSKGTVPATI